MSEAARLYAGANLEQVDLGLQLGCPTPAPTPTGVLAGWVWVPVMPGERFGPGPAFEGGSLVHVREVARRGHTGRRGTVGASVLVWGDGQDVLEHDVELATTWDWTRDG